MSAVIVQQVLFYLAIAAFVVAAVFAALAAYTYVHEDIRGVKADLSGKRRANAAGVADTRRRARGSRAASTPGPLPLGSDTFGSYGTGGSETSGSSRPTGASSAGGPELGAAPMLSGEDVAPTVVDAGLGVAKRPVTASLADVVGPAGAAAPARGGLRGQTSTSEAVPPSAQPSVLTYRAASERAGGAGATSEDDLPTSVVGDAAPAVVGAGAAASGDDMPTVVTGPGPDADLRGAAAPDLGAGPDDAGDDLPTEVFDDAARAQQGNAVAADAGAADDVPTMVAGELDADEMPTAVAADTSGFVVTRRVVAVSASEVIAEV